MKRVLIISAATFAISAITSFVSPRESYANSSDLCDEVFEHRNDLQKAKEALQCYEDALKSGSTDASEIRRLRDGAFRSLAWLYTKIQSDSQKSSYANRGISIASNAKKTSPQDAIGYYWDAVFTSLFCKIADKGKVIPGCIMGSKKEIMQNLETTRKLDIALEGAGGSRILGIMLTQMPKIVGGNKKRGETLLEEALSKAPDYSANFLELGRFYLDQKKNAEATKVLSDFISLNCSTMNPTRALECTLDQEEAKKLLRSLR